MAVLHEAKAKAVSHLSDTIETLKNNQEIRLQYVDIDLQDDIHMDEDCLSEDISHDSCTESSCSDSDIESEHT